MSFFAPPDSGNSNKRKQEHFTLSIKQTVLERAHNRCQKCSVKFSPRVHPKFERINGSLKDNRPANLRALCPECYVEVEKRERTRGLIGNLARLVRAMPIDLKK